MLLSSSLDRRLEVTRLCGSLGLGLVSITGSNCVSNKHLKVHAVL